MFIGYLGMFDLCVCLVECLYISAWFLCYFTLGKCFSCWCLAFAYLPHVQGFCYLPVLKSLVVEKNTGNFCLVWRSMVKGIGETFQGTLWPQGHLPRLQVMLRSTSSGSLQGGRTRGDQVSMTSQWWISKKQNLLHQTLPGLLHLYRIRNCLAWWSRNMIGKRHVMTCLLFSTQQMETCSWQHHCMGFPRMNLDHRSIIYLDNLHGCQFSPCDTSVQMQLICASHSGFRVLKVLKVWIWTLFSDVGLLHR